MKELFYLIHQAEDYGENHVILATFKDKKKAERYVEIEKFLNPYDSIWLSEESFKDEEFDENTRVTCYYEYTIDIEGFTSLEELDMSNESWNQAEPSYWYADNYVEISAEGNFIVGYSNESYDRAREIALDYFKRMKLKGNYKYNYEILDRRNKDENNKY